MLIHSIASRAAEIKSMPGVCLLALVLTACGGSESEPSMIDSNGDALAGGNQPTENLLSQDVNQVPIAVQLNTNMGAIVISLDMEKAPLTVENFLNYVDGGHYNGTIFHRVIDGFMIQGGGFTAEFEKKPTFDPVANEADNGLLNKRYSIAMARTSDPQSATSQFYINVDDNSFLDYSAPTNAGWGYAVFGSVSDGSAVVDRIATLATTASGPFARDVPLQTVVIESIVRFN